MSTKAARDGASGAAGTAGAGAGSGDRAAVAKEAGVDPRDVAYVPLGSLRADPRNPKAHDEGLIGASINRFGLLDVIVQDGRTGYIVSGHGRQKVLRAMKERGEVPPEGVLVDEQTGDWQVPVIVGWSSRSDTEAAAALIALNRSTELGGWVDDSLLGLLDMLVEEDDSALAVVGFGEDEIEVLRNKVSAMDVFTGDESALVDEFLDASGIKAASDLDYVKHFYRRALLAFEDQEAVDRFLEAVGLDSDGLSQSLPGVRLLKWDAFSTTMRGRTASLKEKTLAVEESVEESVESPGDE